MAGIVSQRPLALADLADIWSFIADDSETNADRCLDKLDKTLRLLATQPQMGRARPELMVGLHSFPYARYVVFYRAQPDGIDVVRVLHSARDIAADDFESSSAGP